MKPILKQNFWGVPSGEIYPVQYEAGTECPAEFLDAARSINALQTKDIKQAPENKNDNPRTRPLSSKN